MTNQRSIPTVHLNGTSAAELMRQAESANNSLRSALEALQEMAPNARDYYVQGDGAFELARAEYVSRVTRIESVMAEVRAIHEAICEQDS